MKNKFLFELGTEEIPADMISSALDQMRQGFEEVLQEHQIQCESIRPYCASRRLAIVIAGLPEREPEREEVVLGPPKSKAFDAEGQPTQAGRGFARKMGVSFQDLVVVPTERGKYLACRKRRESGVVPDILRDALPQIISSLSWSKNMYWRESRFRFVRPLRWYLILWNGKMLPFEFEGVRADHFTVGHRFLGKKKIRVASVDGYLKKLRENYVLADVEERRAKILKEIEAQTPKGLQILSDPDLLEAVIHLNEYPTVLRGSFDRKFLQVPQEVLVTVMRHHQKYFSVLNGNQEIQPYFLTVANTNGDADQRIRRGHEKVLKARLEDASFFWRTDQKTTLENRVPQLDHILFQENLGSYRDKAERIRLLCRQLGGDRGLDTAALLSKTDLSTEMVRELPELQGIMGGLYAREQGHSEPIWKAIYEHYRPVSLEDDLPSTPNGSLLSISDKLDTVVGCLSVGIVPTGSSDPFALRRQAQGMMKILLDARLDYPLPWLVEIAQQNFSSDRTEQELRDEVLEFLQRRVRFLFQDKGIPYDVLNAILAVGIEAIYPAYQKALALVHLKGEADFEAVASAYKRIKNILAQQTIDASAVAESDLVEPAELSLYQAFRELEPKVEADLKEFDYTRALGRIAALRGSVDGFFDEVMVLTDDERLRRNRLRLLYDLSQVFLRIADISEIVESTDTLRA